MLPARRTNVLLIAVQVCLPRLAVSVLPPAALSERRPAADAGIISTSSLLGRKFAAGIHALHIIALHAIFMIAKFRDGCIRFPVFVN